MRSRLSYLVLVWLAGCSSGPVVPQERPASAHAAYHHEPVSEFNDGDTTFLQLVPDREPLRYPQLRPVRPPSQP